MTKPIFIGLVQSLIATGEAAMGELSPVHHRFDEDGLKRSVLTATRSLELLEMLEEKTQGNLDILEMEILSQGIQTLRALLAGSDQKH